MGGIGPFSFFKSDMESKAHFRHALQSDLRNALANGEFAMHYQTLIDAHTQRVCGVEALLRWNNAKRGLLVPPDICSFRLPKRSA